MASGFFHFIGKSTISTCEAHLQLFPSLSYFGFRAGSRLLIKLQNHNNGISVFSSVIGSFARKRQNNFFWDVQSVCQLREELDKLDRQNSQGKFTLLASLLKGCCNLKAVTEGMRLHAHIAKTRYEKDTFLANLLTDMYGKCGRVELARDVFDKLLDKDVYSWNAMIAAYVQNGHTEEALKVFQKMKQGSILPDKVTFATIINACASPALLDKGRLIHDEAVGIGCHLDLYVGTALIKMYGKCGNLDNAYEVFEKLPDKTVISWTAMVGAYVEAGHDEAALGLFKRMQEEGVKPNKLMLKVGLARRHFNSSVRCNKKV